MRDLYSWKNPGGRKILIAGIMGILILAALPVSAGDGRYDLLPDGSSTFEITEPGAYILVSNVKMTANVTCILIKTSNVDIDLGGHTIEGTGSGDQACGIVIEKTTQPYPDNVRIHNGTIRNFGSGGIFLGTKSHVHDVSALSNKMAGIYVDKNSLVENCRAIDNNAKGFFAGIIAGANSIARNNIANNNSCALTESNINVYGILVGSGCNVTGNTANGNEAPNSSNGTALGIFISNKCFVESNVCNGNNAKGAAYGIGSSGIAADHCIVRNNTCSSNHSDENLSAGIRVGSHCLVTGNGCCDNKGSLTGTGIRTSFACIIRENTCSGNSGDTVYGVHADSNCRIEGNTCHNNKGESSAYGIQSGSYCRILNNISYFQNAKSTRVAGIYAGMGSRVKENIISYTYGMPDSTADVSAIFTDAANVDIIGNKCYGTTTSGTGRAAGIRLDYPDNGGKGCLIEGNVCEMNKDYGIWINGTGSRIIGNRTCKNGVNSIKIGGIANYYAANIYQKSEPIAALLGNISGTSPAPNVGF